MSSVNRRNDRLHQFFRLPRRLESHMQIGHGSHERRSGARNPTAANAAVEHLGYTTYRKACGSL